MKEGDWIWVRAQVKSADDKKVKCWIHTPWGWKSLVIADAREVKASD